tara:strand:- start:493 stop:1287 length:795 start_codon:yes stop_codon:yes gene_type:complete
MATLTGNQIDQSYLGLLKTTDNAAIGATSKVLTDGAGNALTLSASTVGMEFTGTIDFTGATVLGAGGAAGLQAGTGFDSMESAASLTTNAADAQDTNGIALGNGCFTSGTGNSIFLGANGQASDGSVGIGNSAVAIGTSIALHDSARATGSRSVSIGRATDTSGNQAIGISGEGGTVSGAQATGVGSGCNIQGDNSGGFGYQTSTGALASGAFAIGNGVSANIANTTSVTELEVQLNGGGITLYSPNGTAYKVTVSDAGALVVA